MINQKFQVEESPLFIPLKSLKNINLGSWVVNTYQNYGWYNVQIYIIIKQIIKLIIWTMDMTILSSP